MYTAKIAKRNNKYCNDNWLVDNSSSENVVSSSRLKGDCREICTSDDVSCMLCCVAWSWLHDRPWLSWRTDGACWHNAVQDALASYVFGLLVPLYVCHGHVFAVFASTAVRYKQRFTCKALIYRVCMSHTFITGLEVMQKLCTFLQNVHMFKCHWSSAQYCHVVKLLCFYVSALENCFSVRIS